MSLKREVKRCLHMTLSRTTLYQPTAESSSRLAEAAHAAERTRWGLRPAVPEHHPAPGLWEPAHGQRPEHLRGIRLPARQREKQRLEC